MTWTVLSFVNVTFANSRLADDHVQPLEELLRKDGNVDNLTVHLKGVSFHLWAHQAIDYTVLDTLKKKLIDLGYADFEITAEEYAKSGKGYHYASPPAR